MRSSDNEADIQSEIRRRVIQRSAMVERQTAAMLETEDTLEALHDLTGLPLSEIETIAREVRESFRSQKAEAFSIRNQVLIVASLGLMLMLLIGLFIWIL